VANFVCTAWPVDDLAARQFARRLYAGLLGLRPGPEGGPDAFLRIPPQRMYEAMRDARREVALTYHGIQTWGAYQHYGSPYYRFFAPRRPRTEP
jgi:hypothetical protein